MAFQQVSPERVTIRWVTVAQYSKIYSISRQSLANWRFRDRQAGRTEAQPGFPQYRYFGRAVRYLVDEKTGGDTAA
jgi:hypothetical protein